MALVQKLLLSQGNVTKNRERIMGKIMPILVGFLLSGCINIDNHKIVGDGGISKGGYISISKGPSYDELIYSGTRRVCGVVWEKCHSCSDLYVIPFGIIYLPLEIAMDTITFPYDVYGWFQADELALRPWYERAEQGDAKAQYIAGFYYYVGVGGVKEDRLKTVKWWLKSAKQGYETAQYMLGWCYSMGYGVEKDAWTAVQWYHKAAEQGYPEAQFRLGACYYRGEGVVKDEEKAVEWWGKAAALGNEYAKEILLLVR